MTTLAAPSASLSSTRTKALVAALVLAGFGVYSMWVIAGYGYTGFLALAAREPWAMQMLVDLVIACAFAAGWMIRDARKRRLAVWPFVVLTVLAGSIGLLAYVVRRGFVRS